MIIKSKPTDPKRLFKITKTAVICITAVMILAMTGCTDTAGSNSDNTEGVNDMPAYTVDYNENLKFMMDTYGLSEEELAGLDLARLIEDYRLREEDYTADEIREIIIEEGDMYQDDGTTELYYILDTEAAGGLPDDAVITTVGFYLNSGTAVDRYVFDINGRKVYINGPDACAMDDSDAQALAEMAGKYGVSGWDAHTSGEEEPSTGNYAWKLVFRTEDGKCYAYDGYTQDMTHLPENYDEVRQVIRTAAENAQ